MNFLSLRLWIIQPCCHPTLLRHGPTPRCNEAIGIGPGNVHCDVRSFEPTRPGSLPFFSRNQIFDHMSAIDDFDRAVAGGHQFLVSRDAHLVIDRGGEVFDAQRVIFRLRRGRIG